jgi:hypothetical protein
MRCPSTITEPQLMLVSQCTGQESAKTPWSVLATMPESASRTVALREWGEKGRN